MRVFLGKLLVCLLLGGGAWYLTLQPDKATTHVAVRSPTYIAHTPESREITEVGSEEFSEQAIALTGNLTDSNTALHSKSRVFLSIEQIELLSDDNSERAFDKLMQLEPGNNGAQLKTLIMALGDSGRVEAIVKIMALYADAQPDIQIECIEALADLGRDDAVWALADVLTNPDPEVRRAAIYALDDIATPQAKAVLYTALQEQDDALRHLANNLIKDH